MNSLCVCVCVCVCTCLYREVGGGGGGGGGGVERKEKENISERKINDAIPSFIPLVHECVCVPFLPSFL